MGPSLLITNDFPPRPGGIQQFVHNLAIRQQDVVVYASTFEGAEKFDAEQPFEVVRAETGMLLPTPKTARQVEALARARGCERVWFGAAAPLGLLGEGLRRRAAVQKIVAITHGHEVGWAALPGARTLLRRIARGADVVTYLGEYTRSRLDKAIGGLTTLERLAPGVDVDAYSPKVDKSRIKLKYRLQDRKVVVCVSRLVPRKGQDVLIRAWPQVKQRVPEAALLIVSGGPYGDTLRKLAREHHVEQDVTFTGPVPWDELPAHYAAGDVFAMPCRTRRRGLDVEGLGIVYLEASATGLPVLAGDSGGAPDAVKDGETGFVVGGRDVNGVADRLVTLLTDDALAARMGTAGRAWVESEWRWETQADRLRALLGGE